MMRKGDEMDDERLDARLMSDDAVEDAVLRYLDESPELVSGMAPARDLWPDIEARIGARVLPLGRESVEVRRAPRHLERRPWLSMAAAAAFLVASTAGVTYVLTKRSAIAPSQVAAHVAPRSVAPTPTEAPEAPEASGAPTQVAAATPDAGTSEPAGTATGKTPSAARTMPERKETYEAPRATSHAVSHGPTATLAHYPARLSDEARVTYDDEITRLHEVLEARRDQLDPTTVATVERNLHIIDDAIAQARAALVRDPHSQLLNEQLDRTLAKKTQLLRAATLLPSA